MSWEILLIIVAVLFVVAVVTYVRGGTRISRNPVPDEEAEGRSEE